MKKFAQILIIILLLAGAGRAWAIDLVPWNGLGAIPNVNANDFGQVWSNTLHNEGNVDPNNFEYPQQLKAALLGQGNFVLHFPDGQLQATLDNNVTHPGALSPTDAQAIQDELNRRDLYRTNFRDSAANPTLLAQNWLSGHQSSGTQNVQNDPAKKPTDNLPTCSLSQPGNCILRVMGWIGQLLVWLFSWLVWAANEIFDMAINISVRDFTQYANLPGVKAAWTICRDLVNVTFIFVLLYVAISTILQINEGNARKILAHVIIAALLVNFSMFFTRIMIDASNVVANQFYTAAAGGKTTKLGAPDLSSALTAADTNAFFSLKSAFGDKAGVDPNDVSIWTQMGALLGSYFGQIVLMLITTTVLLAGAFMFFARTVVLILIIVLSPLAFLGFAVGGKLGEFAGDWKKKLTNQLIFAPVYLLLIYMVVQVVTSGGAGGIAELVGTQGGLISSLVVFVIINGLMIGALLAAKSLGVAGAEAGMKLGSKPSKWLAGLATGAAGYYPRRLGQYGKRLIGGAAENLQRSDSRFARAMRSVPLVTRGAGRLGGIARGDVAETQKKIEALNLSDAALKNRLSMTSVFTSAAEKTAITNILATRSNLTPASNNVPQVVTRHAAEVQATIGRQQAIGGNVRAIQEQAWQFATEAPQQAQAIQGRPAAPGQPAIPMINPQAVARLNANQYFVRPPGAATPPLVRATHARNQQVRNAMYAVFHGGHIQNLLERGDDSSDIFFENLRADLTAAGRLPTWADLITQAETPRPAGGWGNPRLAAWARSQAGRDILTSYGIT